MIRIAQQPSVHAVLDPGLRDYNQQITILVAFLEATAQQLRTMPPPALISWKGILGRQ
jgi:hypothetical protein